MKKKRKEKNRSLGKNCIIMSKVWPQYQTRYQEKRKYGQGVFGMF